MALENRSIFVDRITSLIEARRMNVRPVIQPTHSSQQERSPNTLIRGDTLGVLKSLPSGQFDIAVVDPPYRIGSKGGTELRRDHGLAGMGGSWEIFREEWDHFGLKDYFDFTIDYLSEVKRLVKPSGSFWIHGTYHNIGIINFCLQLLDIEIINEVIWYKRNSFPNLRNRRLTASHESILWCHTGGQKGRSYLFNAAYAKEIADDFDRLKEFGKQLRTVWDIPNNKSADELAAGNYPAQKPVRLVRRMLKISARPGMHMLSPFCGSGTDLVAAHQEGCSFLGIDNNPEAINICRARLGNEKFLHFEEYQN